MKTGLEKILKKIEKLMALSKSDNEHEAASALAKANALIKKHDLHESYAEFQGLTEEEVETKTTRHPAWLILLSSVVGEAFECSNFYGSRSISFVGNAVNSKVCTYAFESLSRQLLAARKGYIASLPESFDRGRKRKLGNAYCESWCFAVKSKVREFAAPLSSDQRQLHKDYLEKVGDYTIEDAPQKPLAINSDDDWVHDAAVSGRNAGEKAQLHHGLNESNQQRLGDQ